MTLVQTELKSMKIWQTGIATQGPCPSGFHVPTSGEWSYLISSMIAIGVSSGTDYHTYLKMPSAGVRSYTSGEVVGSTVTEYWSSTGGTGLVNKKKAYFFIITREGNVDVSLGGGDQGASERATGVNLRAFKNEPVSPDSNWTNLYGTSTAGIYHNTTDGLISIVNGSNVITIQDKNLGATTVWNYGDTVTSANSGYYYQRGNNYGFPGIDTQLPSNMSTTQVSASGYGPGNYFSSDTFIYNNIDWSSVQNGNLWGGEDGSVPISEEKEIKRVTIRPNVARLPAEYQEVEYIQSSGIQYIVTSIIPSNTKGIYMKLSSQDITTDLLYIGSRKTTNTRFWIGNSQNSSGNLYLGRNTNDRGIISADTVFKVKLNYLNDRKKQVNNTVIVSNLGTLSSSNDVPIYIFAGNDNYSTDPSLYAPSKIKLYSCKISDGSDIVNDFVPCYRKSDSVIGLYDLVNDVFYTNSGTGTFTKGADIPSQVEKIIRPVGGLPYDNVYITNSGIYTGTDASPLTTQIKAATIYGAWYDREQNVIRMYTNNGVGWYDFNTDVITIVDSYTRTSRGGSMAFYGDYIVVQCGDSYVAIMDRATKTKTRTINIPSGSYTGCVLNSPYDQTCKYVILGLGYANKYVYDVTTGTQGSSWGNSYFQVRCFNDKVIKTCENSQYTAINISDAPNGAGSVTIESGTYKQQTTRIVDSGMLKRVTSDDFEYNTYFIGCSRSTTNTKLINVSTKSTIATLSTGNKNIQGQSIKYNSQYALCFGNGNNNANTNRLWKINRSDYSFTEITTGNGDRINILSSGNIAAVGKGIIGIDGTVVYSNSNFITAFSKDAYNG